MKLNYNSLLFFLIALVTVRGQSGVKTLPSKTITTTTLTTRKFETGQPFINKYRKGCGYFQRDSSSKQRPEDYCNKLQCTTTGRNFLFEKLNNGQSDYFCCDAHEDVDKDSGECTTNEIKLKFLQKRCKYYEKDYYDPNESACVSVRPLDSRCRIPNGGEFTTKHDTVNNLCIKLLFLNVKNEICNMMGYIGFYDEGCILYESLEETSCDSSGEYKQEKITSYNSNYSYCYTYIPVDFDEYGLSYINNTLDDSTTETTTHNNISTISSTIIIPTTKTLPVITPTTTIPTLVTVSGQSGVKTLPSKTTTTTTLTTRKFETGQPFVNKYRKGCGYFQRDSSSKQRPEDYCNEFICTRTGRNFLFEKLNNGQSDYFCCDAHEDVDKDSGECTTNEIKLKFLQKRCKYLESGYYDPNESACVSVSHLNYQCRIPDGGEFRIKRDTVNRLCINLLFLNVKYEICSMMGYGGFYEEGCILDEFLEKTPCDSSGEYKQEKIKGYYNDYCHTYIPVDFDEYGLSYINNTLDDSTTETTTHNNISTISSTKIIPTTKTLPVITPTTTIPALVTVSGQSGVKTLPSKTITTTTLTTRKFETGQPFINKYRKGCGYFQRDSSSKQRPEDYCNEFQCTMTGRYFLFEKLNNGQSDYFCCDAHEDVDKDSGECTTNEIKLKFLQKLCKYYERDYYDPNESACVSVRPLDSRCRIPDDGEFTTKRDTVNNLCINLLFLNVKYEMCDMMGYSGFYDEGCILYESLEETSCDSSGEYKQEKITSYNSNYSYCYTYIPVDFDEFFLSYINNTLDNSTTETTTHNNISTISSTITIPTTKTLPVITPTTTIPTLVTVSGQSGVKTLPSKTTTTTTLTTRKFETGQPFVNKYRKGCGYFQRDSSSKQRPEEYCNEFICTMTGRNFLFEKLNNGQSDYFCCDAHEDVDKDSGECTTNEIKLKFLQKRCKYLERGYYDPNESACVSVSHLNYRCRIPDGGEFTTKRDTVNNLCINLLFLNVKYEICSMMGYIGFYEEGCILDEFLEKTPCDSSGEYKQEKIKGYDNDYCYTYIPVDFDEYGLSYINNTLDDSTTETTTHNNISTISSTKIIPTTKTLPVITSTTTIPTETFSTKCIPMTVTYTEKEYITVTVEDNCIPTTVTHTVKEYVTVYA